MQHTEQLPPFGKWRNRLWPFHRHEMKKLFPLILMKFLVSVIYCVLFCLKDTIAITSEGSGAEAIPVLKSIVVFPAALIAAFCYSRLSSLVKKTTLFYTTTASFLLFLFVYAFFIYPNPEPFTPHQSADWLTSVLGENQSHWVSVYRNWMHSLFFAVAELWGSVMILVVFWGFANEITTVSEAKRSYNIYIAAGNLAPLITGKAVNWISKKLSIFAFSFTVQCLITFVLVAGITIIGLYGYVQKKVLSSLPEKPQEALPPAKKEKISFFQGLKHLITSPYLLGITVLVIGYGLCITLVEISWKANLKLAFPNQADFQAFTAECQSLVGGFAFFISAFLGSSILRRFGWHATAQMAPLIVGGTGLVFLLLCSNPSMTNLLAPMIGSSPLFLLVYLGAFHNISSKIAKYSFFDPTKEMAYIPLTETEKVKGKASIDIVGSRLGKSGASWISLVLIGIMGTGSVLSTTHALVPLTLIATVAWMIAVSSLNRKFALKIAQPEPADEPTLTTTT
jgi:AAA family ATP:ADP antiporter